MPRGRTLSAHQEIQTQDFKITVSTDSWAKILLLTGSVQGKDAKEVSPKEIGHLFAQLVGFELEGAKGEALLKKFDEVHQFVLNGPTTAGKTRTNKRGRKGPVEVAAA